MAESKQTPKNIFLDIPFLAILTRPFSSAIAPVWRAFCAMRWVLSSPIQIPVLPRCFPGFMKVPYLKRLPHITYGEVLFLIPVILILYLAIDTSFLHPHTKDSGTICSYPIYIIFLTANKSNSLITFALGIPFERLINVHYLFSVLAVVTGAFHTYAAYYLGDKGRLYPEGHDSGDSGSADGSTAIKSDYALNGDDPSLVDFLFDGQTNWTGTVALFAMLLLLLTSALPILRRWFFEVWYFPHLVLALVAGIFAAIHGAGSVILVLIWWGVDLLTRYALMAGYLYPHEAVIRKLPGDIVEIKFPKPASFDYEAGQYIMIAVPEISFCQFHPFTISSAPHHDNVLVHLKVSGKWTNRLSDLADHEKAVNILMEGPYTNLSVNLDNRDKYKMVLMIAGGIGVTPMQSIASHLMKEINDDGREMKKLKFVWTVKSTDIVEAMQDTMSNIDGPSIYDALDVDLYVTQKSADEETDKVRDVTYGRPDIDAIFKDMKEAGVSVEETSIAVLVCGPSTLVDYCREASRSWSDVACKKGGGVQFDFHEETFEW